MIKRNKEFLPTWSEIPHVYSWSDGALASDELGGTSTPYPTHGSSARMHVAFEDFPVSGVGFLPPLGATSSGALLEETLTDTA